MELKTLKFLVGFSSLLGANNYCLVLHALLFINRCFEYSNKQIKENVLGNLFINFMQTLGTVFSLFACYSSSNIFCEVGFEEGGKRYGYILHYLYTGLGRDTLFWARKGSHSIVL